MGVQVVVMPNIVKLDRHYNDALVRLGAGKKLWKLYGCNNGKLCKCGH